MMLYQVIDGVEEDFGMWPIAAGPIGLLDHLEPTRFFDE
jgi:hypothetical protein